MPQNDFVPFATGSGANVYSVASYTANAARSTGVVAGDADPTLANNSWRQGTVWASVLGQFLVSRGYDALDNGDTTALLSNLTGALTALIQSGAVPSTALLHSGTDTSTTPNAIAISNPIPAIGAYANFQIFEIIPANAVTGPATVAIGGLGPVPLLHQTGTSMASGDAPQGQPFLVVYLNGNMVRLGLTVSEIKAFASTSITQTAVVPSKSVQFFTAGTFTWTCPANVSLIYLRVVGGGASGNCGTANAGGGGGGAGGSTEGYATVAPGTVYNVVVGAGGASVSNSSNYGGAYGLAGGSSSFANIASAPGASAGAVSTSSGSVGGNAGTGLVRSLPGNWGNDGSPFISSVGGSGGVSPYQGAGRAGTPGGATATGPGSGGGASYGPTPGSSGAGAAGGVEILY